jgi:hypothetical protein
MRIRRQCELRCGGRKRGELAVFQMLQVGVQKFFDAVQLRAPHFFDFFETPIKAVKAAIDVIEP